MGIVEVVALLLDKKFTPIHDAVLQSSIYCLTTSQCKLASDHVTTYIFIVPDEIVVNFNLAEDSVRESENNFRVCLQVNPGPFMTQRSVQFNVFSVEDVENVGKCFEHAYVKQHFLLPPTQ